MNILTSIFGFAICLEIFALLGFLVFIRNSIWRVRRNPSTGERKRRKKVGRDTALFLTSLTLFFAGLAFLNFGLFLQSYRTYAIGQPIAQVLVTPGNSPDEFRVRIQELGNPLDDRKMPLREEYAIHGDRWMIEGHLIRFHPLLNLLGFKPIYQLTRIQGSFYSIEDEQSKERTVYSLVEPRDEKWWKWMYTASKSYPIIEMVHGSAVSQDAEAGSEFIVTIVPTGFTLQQAEKK